MKRLIITLSILAACCAATAQNLNPKVQVVNEYDVSVSDADKKNLDIGIPDSLLRFDYHFDYEYFQSEYRGAYDVSKYFVRATPVPVQSEKKQFFLSGGISYNRAPELLMNWQAVNTGRYCMGIDNDFGGYHGAFTSVGGDSFYGYDFDERLEVANVFRLKNLDIKLDLGYDGLYNTFVRYSNYNSGFVSARITSAKRPGNYFHYDFGVKYRYSNDYCPSVGDNNENLVEIDGSIGPALKKDRYKIYIDFAYTFESDKGYVLNNNSLIMVKPHVDLILGKFKLDLGVKMSYADRFNVFPDVTASVKVADDHLNIFAAVQGGEQMNTYSSLKFADHIYNGGMGLLGTTSLERVNFSLGLSGFAAQSFNYMLKAGYSNHYGAVARCVDVTSKSPGFTRIDYNRIYASLMLGWNNERVESDLTFDYNKIWVNEKETVFQTNQAVFLTPDFKLKARFTYNWSKRIYAGAWVEWNSEARTCNAPFASTPSFVDLGVIGKYKFNSKWGIWLKGSNLLNQEIWYSDFYAQKGIACTAGFTLTF